MSSEAPEGWSQTTLGAIADITRGVSWRDENEVPQGTPGALPVLGIRNVQQSLRLDETVWLGGLSPRVVASSTVRSGDILMVGSNGNPARIGNAVQIDVPGAYLYASLLFGLRPDDAKVEGKFLFHLIRSDEIQQAISETVQGSTGLANLKITVLRDLQLALPPLDEQRRIARVLTSMDEAVRSAEAVRDAANAVYRASLVEMLEGVTFDWQTVRLGEVADFINGRGFKPHEWETSGLPIIRIQNLNGGTDFNFYSGAYNPKILVSTGDLLFAWSGSRGTSFGPHIWKGPNGLLNYHTWRVVPRELSDAHFLYFSLLRLTTQIENEAHGASALVHTQKAAIVDYETRWPPAEVRAELATALSEIDDARLAAADAVQRLGSLRSHVASDLLFGRVRVPAPISAEDEASAQRVFKHAVTPKGFDQKARVVAT